MKDESSVQVIEIPKPRTRIMNPNAEVIKPTGTNILRAEQTITVVEDHLKSTAVAHTAT